MGQVQLRREIDCGCGCVLGLGIMLEKESLCRICLVEDRRMMGSWKLLITSMCEDGLSLCSGVLFILCANLDHDIRTKKKLFKFMSKLFPP